MRAERNGRPGDTAARVPLVFELFHYGGQLTADQLAVGLGLPSGAAAVKCCREIGLPLRIAGFVNGGKFPQKLYALDTAALWRALEEAIRQIDRYALILQSNDPSKGRRTFRMVGKWMQHVRRIEKLKRKKPGRKHGSLLKTRAASRG